MVSIKRDEKPVYQDIIRTDNHWDLHKRKPVS